MAGPNFIHVRDSDSIVVGVFTTTQTTPAGVTEYSETHPVFFPSWTETEWERTGVNTYVDTGVSVNPEFTDPEVFGVLVSSDDFAPDFLDGKIVGGVGITTTVLTDSVGFETLEISSPTAGTDEKVKVTANDTTSSVLFDKLTGTIGRVVITEVNDGGDEDLNIDIGGDIFDKTVDDSDDITEGITNLFFTDERVDDRVASLLVGGTSITLTYDDSAGSITIDNDFAEEVRVSSDDTTTGFLIDKIVAGSGITVTELSDSAGSETLEISAPGSTTDEKVKVTSNDTTPDYLFSKVVGTVGKIVITEVGDGGDEDLKIDIGGDIFDTSVDTSDDITEGTTNLFFTEERVDDRVAALLIGGTSITLSYDDSAGSITIDNDFAEQVRVSSNDTTPGYLLSKITGTVGRIVVSEVGDGGDEDLNIDIGGNIFDTTIDDTDNITEGTTNLFFTDERVDDRVAALLIGGTSITLTYDDSAGSITIENDFAEQVRVTSNDTTPGYLFNKIIGTTGKVVVTEVNDGGDEDLQIDIGGDIFDTSIDTTDDITEGTTNLFYTDERVDDRVAALLIGGTSITLTYDDSAGSITIDNDDAEEVKVSSDDSAPGFLIDKIVAGTGISLSELSDSSGFETLEISASGSTTDELVKVTSNDTTSDYLFSKIIGTTGKITVTEINDGGDEDLQIDVGGDIFDTSVNTTDDITEGATNLFYTDERVDDRVASLLFSSDSSVGLSYNDGANTLDVTVNEANVDHNTLLNFVSNKHIDHTSVSVVLGGDDALAVTNNDLSANIGLRVDITGTTAETVADNADEILIYDVTAGALRKMTRANFVSGLGSTADLASVTVSNSSSVAIPTTWADVSWNTTHVENNTAVIEHDNTFTDRILIKETGLYFLSFSISFDADAGEETIEARVRRNDTTIIPGSHRLASEDDEINDLSNAITCELVSGDFISLQHQASGTGNVLHSSSNFSVTRARGATGAQGPAGSGSSITVQEEGVGIPSTPHTSLNFVGTGITASDAGGGVAQIRAVFGDQFQEVSNLAQGQTTSTSPVQRLTMSFTAVAGAKYIVTWSFTWRYSSTGFDFLSWVQLDNSTTLWTLDSEPSDTATTQREPASGFAMITPAAGSRFIDLDWWSEDSGETAFIYNARMSMWRVS
jgi:uncharacterized membrane protein (Fun14 family)